MTLTNLIESRLEWLDDKSVEEILLELASAVDSGPEALERYKQELLEFVQHAESSDVTDADGNRVPPAVFVGEVLEVLKKSLDFLPSASVLQQVNNAAVLRAIDVVMDTHKPPQLSAIGDTITVKMPRRFVSGGAGE